MSVFNSPLRDLPIELQESVADYTWQEIFDGFSGVRVWRLESADVGNLYLKVSPRDFVRNLLPEKERLDWLKGKLPVPEVRCFYEENGHQYLLITEVPGLPSHHECFRAHTAEIVRLLAVGLRQIHNLDTADCLFDGRLDIKIDVAHDRVVKNLVSEEDFDAERWGRRAADLYDELLATRPTVEDPVFTHGDYCLPNIIINPEQLSISGFIDWGNAGIADRYQDLALAARSITFNVGAEWVPLFFETYGLDSVDHARLEFYKLLDEFF